MIGMRACFGEQYPAQLPNGQSLKWSQLSPIQLHLDDLPRQRAPDAVSPLPGTLLAQDYLTALTHHTSMNIVPVISHPLPVIHPGVASAGEADAAEELVFPPIMYSLGQLKREASQILPDLFLSDAFTARWGTTLDRLKITHIISVLEEPITFPRTEKSLKLLHIPASDDVNTDLLSFMDQTTEFIKEAIGTSKREQEQLEEMPLSSTIETTDDGSPVPSGDVQENRVLVHCLAGMSRSATIVIAYLLATTPMSTEEATEFVRSKRSIIRPNYGFTKQLEQYERRYFASTGKTTTPKKRVETGIASRIQLYRDVAAGLRRSAE
jgi:atypical dual specificity phosphatase